MDWASDNPKMKITRENFAPFLNKYMKDKGVNERTIADSIGCSEHIILRIKDGKTYPSDEMLVSGTTLLAIGHEQYRKLNEKDRETIFERIGSVVIGIIFIVDIIDSMKPTILF